MEKFNAMLKENELVLVDFYADWCGPCRMLAPIIEQIENEKAGLVKVVKIDVDKETNITKKYNIQSIPTLIIFKNGKETNQLVGYRSKKDIIEALGL